MDGDNRWKQVGIHVLSGPRHDFPNFHGCCLEITSCCVLLVLVSSFLARCNRLIFTLNSHSDFRGLRNTKSDFFSLPLVCLHASQPQISKPFSAAPPLIPKAPSLRYKGFQEYLYESGCRLTIFLNYQTQKHY